MSKAKRMAEEIRAVLSTDADDRGTGRPNEDRVDRLRAYLARLAAQIETNDPHAG